MKVTFLYLRGKGQEDYERLFATYQEKIGHFIKFEKRAIRSVEAERNNAAEKIKNESKSILAQLEKSDFVILFDEKGRKFESSQQFSEQLAKIFSQQHSHFVFIIGGPYGFSDEIKNRAQMKFSLSSLTMNHHVAQLVALEQIYRAMTIWRGLPYHNE